MICTIFGCELAFEGTRTNVSAQIEKKIDWLSGQKEIRVGRMQAPRWRDAVEEVSENHRLRDANRSQVDFPS